MENLGSQYIDQAPLSAGVPAITPDNRYLRVPLDGSNQWSTGLFDCCDDVNNCLITFVCPFVTFGQIAEVLDRGSSSCGVSGAAYGLVCALTGCHFVYSCFYRTKMRAQYGLEETPCADFFAHLFCGWCSLCQEYRELRNRGFDMNIGWHANMERQAKIGAIDVPPTVFDGMSR